MAVTVLDVPEAGRYEAREAQALAGFVAYRRRPGLIAFTHTEVADAYEGQGVGSALARTALDDARARGLAVLPFCPFVGGWIQRHREYVDLVPEDQRGSFAL